MAIGSLALCPTPASCESFVICNICVYVQYGMCVIGKFNIFKKKFKLNSDNVVVHTENCKQTLKIGEDPKQDQLRPSTNRFRPLIADFIRNGGKSQP